MMKKRILSVAALAAGFLVTGVVLVTAGPQSPARRGGGEPGPTGRRAPPPGPSPSRPGAAATARPPVEGAPPNPLPRRGAALAAPTRAGSAVRPEAVVA